jgi:hypothetical protein
MVRKPTNVRLTEATYSMLRKVAFDLMRSQSQVVEDALIEYFTRRGLTMDTVKTDTNSEESP